jgi:hypothetical protein
MTRIVRTPAARASDPITSHLAAQEVTASGARDAQIALVIRAVRQHPGQTSRELALVARLDRYMVARRLPEAVTAGAIRRGVASECSVARRKALTWWPV